MRSPAVLIYLLLSISLPTLADENEIKLTAGNYPPYQAENLKYYGVISRIVTEAFALEGVKVSFTFMPWKRAYPTILEGKLDGVGYATRKKEREAHFYFSDPIFQKQRVFFHLKKEPFDWQQISDLKNLQIGALSGYAYSSEFDEADKDKMINVQRVETHRQNIRRLLAGNRIDVALTTIDQGYDVINKYYPEAIDQITYHPKPLHSPNMYLMLSKKMPKNKVLIEQFNKGLKKLRESGKVQQYFWESQHGEYLTGQATSGKKSDLR